jgi:hypothetical protein
MKSFFKVLSISEAYMFKQGKFLLPKYDLYGNKITIENNISECKKRIYTTYKNQSITVFKFDKNKVDFNDMNKKLIYDNVIDSYDIFFDENNVMAYFQNIDNLENKIKQ